MMGGGKGGVRKGFTRMCSEASWCLGGMMMNRGAKGKDPGNP